MGNTNWEISGVANKSLWSCCNKGNIIYFGINTSNWSSSNFRISSLAYINCVNAYEHGIIDLTGVTFAAANMITSCNSLSNDIYIGYKYKCNIKTGAVSEITGPNFTYNPLNNWAAYISNNCRICGDNNDNIYYVSHLSNNSQRTSFFNPTIMKFNTKNNTISVFAYLPNSTTAVNEQIHLRFDPISNSIIVFRSGSVSNSNTQSSGYVGNSVQCYWLNGTMYSNYIDSTSSTVYHTADSYQMSYHIYQNFPIWEYKYHTQGESTYSYGYYSYWPKVVNAAAGSSNLAWYSNVINGTNKNFVFRYFNHDTGILYSMYIPNGSANDVWWIEDSNPIPTAYYPKWTY